MKVSIITASFNSSANIARCVFSVFNQSYLDIEHIIIDGASTDNTLEIIKNTSNRVSTIISEPDSGIYEALNKGIYYSTGELIAFLHSDDVFASHQIIAKLVKEFSNGEISGVYGNLIFVNEMDKVVRTWKSSSYNQSMVVKGWIPPHPTLVLRKAVYEKYGIFDTSFSISGDYDFMLRILRSKEIRLVFISEVITKMRIGGVSTGSLKGIIQKSKEDIRALKKNGLKYPYLILLAKNFRKLPQLFLK